MDSRLRGNDEGLGSRLRGNGETMAACYGLCAQIKHQHFGVLALSQCQRRLGLQQNSIAGLKWLAIDLQTAAHQKHIGLARGVERQARMLGAIEQAR
ncbi:MAG: hypothetical protein RJB17_2031, partial [Pseudomonadota bacterium]